VFLLSQIFFVAAAAWTASVLAKQDSAKENAKPAAITVNYPLKDSIFPPEITAPTFIWHDSAANADAWRIDVSFADGSPALHLQSKGEAPTVGELDLRCISRTNELPTVSPEFVGGHTWTPDSATWAAIKARSVAAPATVSIAGVSSADPSSEVSLGQVSIQTSKDPLGAPIFYRDVPLMPSDTEKGVIKPLDSSAIPLIKWRLRDVSQPQSRVVLQGMHTCANCHSFSRDGKTMGMDMDGPQNDKGLYALVSLKPETSIETKDMVSWNPSHDLQYKLNRVAFMSQVSPDGQYVINTASGAEHTAYNNFYVVNFKDYRFLQVFYPTKGVLSWYSRVTKERHLLPGADDPRYVQTDAMWSPDGKYLVFARAKAVDAYPADGKMAERANDPVEVQVKYDLYRIPFNGGKGGVAVPIAGASNNGMSNNFPKISPDGRWIVFVQNRNGQLMRPDSQLYIVPAAGGTARRLNANTSRMNSWHSFSPNGRWLVFSSKARSVYTQMYLTHIDENGNDSPPILIDNSTAANRAVNLPEFVNIPPDTPFKISTPAVDMYNRLDVAVEKAQKGDFASAISDLSKLAEEYPDDAQIQNKLGAALARLGQYQDAIPHYKKGLELNPNYHEIHNNLGIALMAQGQIDQAVKEFKINLQFSPDSAELQNNLGHALLSNGRTDEAREHFEAAVKSKPEFADAQINLGITLLAARKPDQAATHFARALESDPDSSEANGYLGVALYYGEGDGQGALEHFHKALHADPNLLLALGNAAHVLAASPNDSERNGEEAVELASRAVKLTKGEDPTYLDTLAMALAENKRFDDAIKVAERAQMLARNQNNAPLDEVLATRIQLYQAGQPYRDSKRAIVGRR
jgi:tetratricopeptide (TPR) repeat protein